MVSILTDCGNSNYSHLKSQRMLSSNLDIVTQSKLKVLIPLSKVINSTFQCFIRLLLG